MNLLQPEKLWSRSEVFGTPCPLPREAGVYAWYFRAPPTQVPLEGCVRHGDCTLLYIGIAPKAPLLNDQGASRQTLWNRIRYHYRGNAEGSTLRLTLGCLLDGELGIQLRRVGSGNRMTFGDGEHVLSDWMAQNALVCWHVTPKPWVLEKKLIGEVSLPLNLDGNRAHAFHATLSARRRAAKESARALPVMIQQQGKAP